MCTGHAAIREKYRKRLGMRSSLVCNKTRDSDLASSKCFPATQHILGWAMSLCPVSAAADTAWISKTDIKDGMGQQAMCMLHSMVRILQVGAESSQPDGFSMSSLGSFPCKLG